LLQELALLFTTALGSVGRSDIPTTAKMKSKLAEQGCMSVTMDAAETDKFANADVERREEINRGGNIKAE